MKIAFVGKGGSGKTTITALFARWLAAHSKTVLAFDADINQHLKDALGDRVGQNAGLHTHTKVIKEYLRGSNPRIKAAATMIKTTPPGSGSRLFTPHSTWLQSMLVRVNGVWTGAAGDLEQDDLGVRCYHSKSGVIELLLGHMTDKADEYVLVDLTAGADPFASSVLAKVDAVCLVVEPNLPSLTVFEQFRRHKQEWVPPLLVIGNKVHDSSDEQWLKDRLGNALVGSLPDSTFVRQEARGEMGNIGKLEAQFVSVFEQLVNKLALIERDLSTYQRRNELLHIKNAKSWAGSELQNQVDPEFSLQKAANLEHQLQ